MVIVPMTSNSKRYPTRVAVKHNKTKGWVVLDQIRAIDRQRIIQIFNSLTEKEIHEIKTVMHEAYVA